MNRRSLLLCLTAVVHLAALPAAARDWIVRADGTGDAPTIQAAVDLAEDADVVILEPGTYRGDGNRDVDLRGKRLTVRGAATAATTIIDCEGTAGSPHRAFHFITNTVFELDATIEDLTIQNGFTNDPGGAVAFAVPNASPRFERCVFADNTGAGGGAVYIPFDNQPVFSQCSFVGNEAIGASGGAVFIDATEINTARFLDCIFIDNQAAADGGALLVRGALAAVEIERCTFTANGAQRGGALWTENATPVVSLSAFDGNAASNVGGAVGTDGPTSEARFTSCSFGANTAPQGGALGNFGFTLLEQCALVGNVADAGGGIYVGGTAGSVTAVSQTLICFNLGGGSVACDTNTPAPLFIQCSNIFGNDGGDWVDCIENLEGVSNNLQVDPEFCSTTPVLDGNWTLQSDSPCASANNQDCGLIGSADAGCQAAAVLPTSWGRLKLRFDDR